MAVSLVEGWSKDRNMQLNAQKIVIDFKENKNTLKSLMVDGKELETLDQAPDARRVDSPIDWINRYPLDNSIALLVFVRWIVIYPVDS